MMREDEERIAQLLRDVAADMPADPELERRTLRRSHRRRVLNAGVGAALVTLLVAGTFVGVRALSPSAPTVAADPSETPLAPSSDVDVVLVVQDLAFDTDRIEIPAGQAVTIRLDNRDVSVHHSFAIYEDPYEGFPDNESVLFRGEIVTGPAVIDYHVPPLDPGTYYFQCDVHPSLNGVLVAGPLGTPTETPPVEPQPGLPDEVAATRVTMLDAVADGPDFGTLEGLLDPMTFAYNFDDGSDPLPVWRDDPSVLEPIPQILDMPFYVTREIEAPDGFVGKFYQWPHLMEPGSLDRVTDQERADLAALGFDDAEIEAMREFGGYTGPRLVIRADGLWTAYVTGGD